jgi:hypothetical protein
MCDILFRVSDVNEWIFTILTQLHIYDTVGSVRLSDTFLLKLCIFLPIYIFQTTSQYIYTRNLSLYNIKIFIVYYIYLIIIYIKH